MKYVIVRDRNEKMFMLTKNKLTASTHDLGKGNYITIIFYKAKKISDDRIMEGEGQKLFPLT